MKINHPHIKYLNSHLFSVITTACNIPLTNITVIGKFKHDQWFPVIRLLGGIIKWIDPQRLSSDMIQMWEHVSSFDDHQLQFTYVWRRHYAFLVIDPLKGNRQRTTVDPTHQWPVTQTFNVFFFVSLKMCWEKSHDTMTLLESLWRFSSIERVRYIKVITFYWILIEKYIKFYLLLRFWFAPHER